MTAVREPRSSRETHRIPTQGLLLGGIVGPSLFLGVGLIEGATRPGYDPVRQFVSVLSLGDGGWVQSANFVVTGLLLVAFGLGLRRNPVADRGRWTPALLMLAGAAVAWSGIFVVDPQWGYPKWISAEEVANPTLHDRLHLAAGFVDTTALSLAGATEAWRAGRAGRRLVAAYAAVSLAIMLVCFLVSLAIEPPGTGYPFAGLLQRIGLVAGFQWLVWLAATQLRVASRRPALDGDPVPAPGPLSRAWRSRSGQVTT